MDKLKGQGRGRVRQWYGAASGEGGLHTLLEI